MRDLSFHVELTWSGTGHHGAGQIQTDDLALELSGPESMGGRGVGTNPEELLVCAVSSCYTATLFAVLRRAQLPVESLAVSAAGTVTGFPAATRFAGMVVTPTVIGGDSARQAEYEAAASLAHDRCFIGHTLAPEVAYEVGSVHVRRDPSLAPTADQPLPGPRDASGHPSVSRAA
jgi:peroxiredoxin-like protein